MHRLALAAVLLATLAPAASAQVAARLADLRLATAVRLALVHDVRTRALDVTVAARDGAVTVAGDVPAATQRTAAEVARLVPGVRSLSGLGSLRGLGATADAPAPAVQIEARPAEPEGPAGGAVYHTVERGDTLFSLARRYGTTVDAILDLNGRQSTDIRIGQRIRVR